MCTAAPVTHHHSHGPANRGRRVLETAAPLFVVKPAGPIRGGVVVLHDVTGLTEDIEQYCRRLARDGWLAAAPYHYYDSGGRSADDPGVPHYARTELTPRNLRIDVAGALDYLADQRGLVPDSLSALGVGMGGYLAAWAAAHHTLAAAVSITPGPPETAPLPGMPSLADLLAAPRGPWLDAGDEPAWSAIHGFLTDNAAAL